MKSDARIFHSYFGVNDMNVKPPNLRLAHWRM